MWLNEREVVSTSQVLVENELPAAMSGSPASLIKFLSCPPCDVDVKFCRYTVDMLTDFIARKLKAAKYRLLEDGTYFGEIPGFRGVWANAKNLEDCREELREVLEDWILLKVKANESIPGF